MHNIGKTIKRLRLSKGDTQEKLAEALHISCQAVSKWENGLAVPDIALLPCLADYFAVTIDELMNYKLRAYTNRERFVRLLAQSGVLTCTDGQQYRINTENLGTNAQIVKIGECFADLIRENRLSYDGIIGLAYHGISFSAGAACALFQKYGVTTAFAFDRQVPDSRSRRICGFTPAPGDRVIVIDDVIGSGQTMDARLERLVGDYGIQVAAVMAIADTQELHESGLCGSAYIRKK